MKMYFDKPTAWNWLIIIMIWVLIIAAAVTIGSCKARKVNKSSTEIVDKSNSQEKTSKSDSTRTKVTGKTTAEDTKKDSSSYTRTITTEYFEPNGTIPPGSPKKKTETETGQSKSEENKNQIDESLIDHSGIKKEYSEKSNKNDIEIEESEKQVETKDNTLYWWIGAAVAAIMVVGFVVWVYRSK